MAQTIAEFSRSTNLKTMQVTGHQTCLNGLQTSGLQFQRISADTRGSRFATWEDRYGDNAKFRDLEVLFPDRRVRVLEA